MDNMQIFKYKDDEPRKMRVLVVEGAPWLVLSDLSKILRLSNAPQLARTIPSDERRYAWLCGELNSRLEYIVISEKGLQIVLKRYESKPGIDRVTAWIQQDVLPHITRKGGFPASILHEERETPKACRKPSTERRVDSVPAIPQQEAAAVPVTCKEKFVVPVTKINETKTKNGPDMSFVLWEVEMFLRVARMKGITERQRMWAINNALREVRKKKPLGGAEDELMKLPEVIGHITHRRKKNLDQNDWVVVNPIAVIAKCVELSPDKVNAFAEAKNMKCNGVDGFWMAVDTPNGTAREFMYTSETMDLLIKSSAQIHLFDSDEAA